MTPPPETPPRITVGVNEVVRLILELFAFFSLGYWGYMAWPFPWPAVAFMIGAPLFAIVVWALFRSPRAVFPVDIVGRGFIEIAVMGSAAIAWAMLGHTIVAMIFGLIALVSGIINLRKESARERNVAG